MLSKLMSALLVSSLVSDSAAFIPISIKSYVLNADFSGFSFFDNFEFYTGADPSKGYVKYVDLTTANSSQLAGFVKTSDSNGTSLAAYIGVDSSQQAPQGRSSVRLLSKQTFNHSLIIADILHMPAAVCGTWPAYWLLGNGADWPKAGEVDIVENINDADYNKYTLHTDAGVYVANTSSTMKGQMTTRNCDIKAADQGPNAGCSVSDPASTESYGNGFNENQGGVFATQFDSNGISIWFFNRTSIPLDIVQGKPHPPPANVSRSPGTAPSIWGLPNARFTGDNVDFDGHFKNLQIIFNTAFCGEWVSKVWSSTSSCSELAPTCEQYVAENPRAFRDVYWLIRSVKVYEEAYAV